MNHKEILKSLSTNNKFILIGVEGYFVDFAVEHLKSGLAKDFAVFNYIEFEQKNTTFNECIIKLDSVPMMDEKKIVHIKDFNFSVDGNSWSKKELADFEEKLKNIQKDTICILTNSSIKKVDRSKLLKDYGKFMNLLVFEKLTANELLFFLEDIFENSLGKNAIKKSVINKFIQISGYTQKETDINLYNILGMSKKIEAYFLEKGEVKDSDIEFLFVPQEDGNIFKMIDSIVQKNKKECFRHFEALKSKGEPTIKIIVTIGKTLSTAIKTSYYLEEGYSQSEIASELGKNPYAITSATNILKKLGREKLIRMLDEIVDMDYKFKSGLISETVYADVLLVKLLAI